MENFKGGWPDSFLPSRQASCHNGCEEDVLVGKERVYDQELIYARAIDLHASSRGINFNDVLAFELVAYPLSMFNANGK